MSVEEEEHVTGLSKAASAKKGRNEGVSLLNERTSATRAQGRIASLMKVDEQTNKGGCGGGGESRKRPET